MERWLSVFGLLFLFISCEKNKINIEETEYLYFQTSTEINQYFGLPVHNQILVTPFGNLAKATANGYSFDMDLNQIDEIPICGNLVNFQSEVISTQQNNLAFFISGLKVNGVYSNRFKLISRLGSLIYELKIPTQQKVEVTSLVETEENHYWLVGRIFNPALQNFDYLIIHVDRFKNNYELTTMVAPENEGFSNIIFNGAELIAYGYQQIIGEETRNLSLFKLDLNLNKLGHAIFNFHGYQEAQDLLLLPNNALVITAHSSETNPLHNILAMKLNSNFEVIWKKEIGEERHEGPESAILDSYGNIVIAGRTNSYGADYQKAILVKISTDGNLISTYNFDNQKDTYINSLFELGHNYYLVGRSIDANGKKELVAIKHHTAADW